MKLNIKTIAAATVAAIGLTVGGIAVAGAAVKPDCKNLMYPLCPRSVAATQVVDNSLPGYKKLAPGSVDESRLNDAVKAKLNAADTPDVKGGAEQVFANKEPVTIDKIGGRFADNATTVGSFTLPKGTWLINLSGKFSRTVAAPADEPEVQPMLQLLAEGNEYGTIMGNDIGSNLGADLTGTSLRLITVRADTEITVKAFGYNEARSSAGGGELTADAVVTIAAA